MKAKNKSESQVFNSNVRRRKTPSSKSISSGKSELLTHFGKDAETIRHEVFLAKQKLKKHPHLFEQLGDNDLLE